MMGRKNVLQVKKFPLNTSRSGGFLLDKKVNLSLNLSLREVSHAAKLHKIPQIAQNEA